jgi:hypothetical protein
MNLMLAASGAELVQVHAVRIVTTVLLGDVVAFFAFCARHSDLGSNIALFLRHQILQTIVLT